MYNIYDEARSRELSLVFDVSGVSITDNVKSIIFVSRKSPNNINKMRGVKRGSAIVFVSYDQSQVREDMRAVSDILTVQHTVKPVYNVIILDEN